MNRLELLAPAKDREVGIAAIASGADSVYIAGPKFGAREKAGNTFEEIAALCSYAHKYRARVYLTLNTILYDNELSEAQDYIWQAKAAGCDAVIVQDMGILKMQLPDIPLFASTQTDIRTPEKALLLASLGFKRLILARELPLSTIAEIREATKDTGCELEFFVHGALCVCYSGQCYLSEYLTGRSANRGACAGACRCDYTLADAKGSVLVKDKPLLSLKDLNLSEYLRELVQAGITSFKIEGRLKNASYVRNVVTYYNRALNKLGTVRSSSPFADKEDFTPDLNATFNRGYTEFFINGVRGEWKSDDAAKGMGAFIGNITSVGKAGGLTRFRHDGAPLHNGDGLCIVRPDGTVLGERANVCSGNSVTLSHLTDRIVPGSRLYRNFDFALEKRLASLVPKRIVTICMTVACRKDAIVVTDWRELCEDSGLQKTGTEKTEAKALWQRPERSGENDRLMEIAAEGFEAQNKETARALIINQLSKCTDDYVLDVAIEKGAQIYFYKTADLNRVRREIIARIARQRGERETNIAKQQLPYAQRETVCADWKRAREIAPAALAPYMPAEGQLSYLANCSNRLARQLYGELGFGKIDKAFELSDNKKDTALMRTKYCLRHQLGLCSKGNTVGEKNTNGPLYLLNAKNRFKLIFDCSRCEMLILAEEKSNFAL